MSVTGGRGTNNRESLGLAGFAPFGFVTELFVVKKQLFACGKDKIATAIDTFQDLILEVHASSLDSSGIAKRSLQRELRCSRPLNVTAPSEFGPPARGRCAGHNFCVNGDEAWRVSF
jgi:hypothetical protein